MKKLLTYGLLATAFLLHSSFAKKGGDMFRVFWNGKQVTEQFVHASKGTKTLQLSALGEKDQLGVMYSHCGQSGKDRSLIFRNENNEPVKTFQFADSENAVSRMIVSGKAFGKTKPGKLYLYYRSKELPNEKLLAILNSSVTTAHASR